jgi:hypothetical protein
MLMDMWAVSTAVASGDGGIVPLGVTGLKIPASSPSPITKNLAAGLAVGMLLITNVLDDAHGM